MHKVKMKIELPFLNHSLIDDINVE